MDPIGAFWHLTGFFAPALALGGISALLCKLLWRGRMASVGWGRLASHASICAALVLGVCLVFFGRDGRMSTYAAAVLATALSLWWTGFAGRR